MLKQDQEVFNIFIETISQGVIIVDDHQVIIEVKKSAVKMFGYQKNELLVKSLNVLIPKEYHEKHSSQFNGFLKEGKNRRKSKDTMDLFGVIKTGNIFPLKIELTPFSDYNKSLSG